MQIPLSLIADPRVQTAALILLLAGEYWLMRRSVRQGEQIAALTAIVTNHYAHRFKQIQDLLGIEYEDEDAD